MNKLIKSTIVVTTAMFLLTACSSKNRGAPVSYSTINTFYKPSSNTKIKNSKAMHRATLRSYNVFGKWYYPKIEKLGSEFTGIASWYGPDFHAKKTSNGEIYDMYAMTAAHKTLPMNTMVKVYNLENGKTTVVRINDRGPFVAGRIIDLSNKAAHAIDMVRKGTAKVRIKVLGYNGEIDNHEAPHGQATKHNTNYSNDSFKENAVGNYSLQVGAFGSMEGAQKTKSKFERITNKYDVIIKKVFSQGRFLHKVYIMGFGSYNEALRFKNKNDIKAFITEE